MEVNNCFIIWNNKLRTIIMTPPLHIDYEHWFCLHSRKLPSFTSLNVSSVSLIIIKSENVCIFYVF